MIKFISGEENSPGWFCGEDEGKVMARGCCPMLASHMSVFPMKSPDRKVRALPYNTGLHLADLFNPFNTFAMLSYSKKTISARGCLLYIYCAFLIFFCPSAGWNTHYFPFFI